MITLKDIAESCGVSVSTVSRALNGVEIVNPERAEAIRAAARRMGYMPNAVARTLKTNRSWMVGILYEDHMNHPFFSRVIDAVRAGAEKRGYDVLFLSRTDRDGRKEYSGSAISRRMDGVVIVYANVDNRSVEKLMSGNIPVVSVDDCDRDCDAVISDYPQGTRRLVQAAYEKGHRRIAFIHGQIGYATCQRLAGYRQAVAELGLPAPDEYVRQGAFNDGRRCAEIIREMMTLPQPPTCILTPDDYSALNAMQLLRERGVLVPRDISLMGYDGIGMGQTLSPRLTTYRQDTAAMGEAIFEALQADIEEGASRRKTETLIRGALIPGETLADIGEQTKG